ncbi:MAG: FtsX-like permease family protein [Marinicaulis sp.]|nr:FtsX-like permease family protein [Marinicaulis sp.]
MRPALSMLDRKMLRDLWRIKGQALAIIFVIAAGIALFVMSSGMMIALEETMRAYYERHRFADAYAPVKRAPNHLLADIRNLDGVSTAEGRINGGGLVTLEKASAPVSARVISYDPDAASPINAVYLVEGRMLRTTQSDEIMLLKPFADAHNLTPGDSIAITMNGAQHTFIIAGLVLSPEFIYALPPGEFVVDAGRFAVLWASEEAMEAAYDLDGAFNEVILTTSRNTNEDGLIDDLDRLLAPYGAVGAFVRADQVSNKYLTEELKQLETMGVVMTPIFLGVAIFLLNIVITRLVHTEREQIGLLKAFGYSNNDVGAHYLKFVLVIALGGALVGWGGGQYLGRLLSGIYQKYFHFPFLLFNPEFRTLGLAVLFSAAAAALGAFSAVRGAVSLSPAVAMRPPAPPHFTRGNAFSKTLTRILDQPSRMILRRVSRQPFRAALTTLGIGAAMGLAVMMRFNMNATDYMLDISFNIADRSDVFVTFAEPLSETTIYELSNIEGVIYAEPFRASAVMFRNDRIEHLGAVTGLPENPVLNRAIDANLALVDIRGDGIVFSEQLADILEIAVGDTVIAEVREGRRPTLEIPVTGLVEAMIGTPAYMTSDALNKKLKEPNRASGAYLKIDMAQRNKVYDKLKSMPLIAGVSLRREAYYNFQKMIDEGPGTFRRIMMVFSIVIAAGVVYNGARIAFIERHHDLASLRVLGFTKIETGYVLFGELALLAILALPVGSLIGLGLWVYIADALSTELYQIPVVFKESGLGYAAIVVLVSTAIAGALVQRDIMKLDLATALKARE